MRKNIHNFRAGELVRFIDHTRVKWFDGDESFEWAKFLRLISESR
ncbi:MAG: hypothetical protein QF416_11565 [Candidatus Marinimicrobia bacterium]|jgi:hypothetical protein|nr:hypothetical protein [Candidatus Neomarinimicrobiota bacterium]